MPHHVPRATTQPSAPDSWSLLDALDHPTALVSASWCVVRANSAWHRVMHTDPGATHAQDLWSCCPIFSVLHAAECLRATASDGATRRFGIERGGRRQDVRATGAGDGLLLIELASPSSPDATRPEQHNGEADGSVVKAELLRRMEDVDLAKSRFIATVSHELRTPLTALTGYEELLADEVLGPLSESQADVVERMRSVTHHLTVMIEELLAFSSLETGRERVRPTEFLAADLLSAVSAIIEPHVRQKQLALNTDVPDQPIRMSTDVDKIRQILVNLATNAVKFTEAGSVTLGVASAPGGYVRFTVRDTGIGIQDDDIDRLFRPFAQLDGGLTRRYNGTGLGLYISRRLVNLLHGEISVTSSPGSGSTFTVELPAVLKV